MQQNFYKLSFYLFSLKEATEGNDQELELQFPA